MLLALQLLQVCTDYLSAADRAIGKAGLRLVDRQLAAAPLSSGEGQDYLAAMATAANFAFANRCVCSMLQTCSFPGLRTILYNSNPSVDKVLMTSSSLG
jgi:hypothetical protein